MMGDDLDWKTTSKEDVKDWKIISNSFFTVLLIQVNGILMLKNYKMATGNNSC